MNRIRFRPRLARQGMTLVEVMFALLIVSIGVLATLSLLSFSRLHNSTEQERARAHQIVSETMEEVKLQLFAQAQSNTTVTIWDNGTPDDPDDDTAGQLTVQLRNPVDGTVYAASPVPAERIVAEVTLTWIPRGFTAARQQSETVMTYLVP